GVAAGHQVLDDGPLVGPEGIEAVDAPEGVVDGGDGWSLLTALAGAPDSTCPTAVRGGRSASSAKP
ncbi:MAG: hypothetical protein ABEK42_04585, partial [Thiohalorhabdaceae bacterium]